MEYFLNRTENSLFISYKIIHLCPLSTCRLIAQGYSLKKKQKLFSFAVHIAQDIS